MPYFSPQWDCGWQALYRAAIFGQNAPSFPSRIAQAEEAIRSRTAELSGTAGQWADSEREGMEDALYALNALKTAQRIPEAA